MKTELILFFLVLLGIGLLSCTSTGPDATGSFVQNTPGSRVFGVMPSSGRMNLAALTGKTIDAPITGHFASRMDSLDRSKLSHALDSSVGKTSHWVNANTGTSYTVTPVRKVTINGNPFCRSYTATAEKGGQTQEINGTACITQDGSWQSAG